MGLLDRFAHVTWETPKERQERLDRETEPLGPGWKYVLLTVVAVLGFYLWYITLGANFVQTTVFGH